MAPTVRLWFAVTGVICLGIAFIYLPPRGRRPDPLTRAPSVATTDARSRAQALAMQWRNAEARARLVEVRASWAATIDSQRNAGPILLILGPDSIRGRVQGRLARELARVWNGLGLGQTKVAVVLVLDFSHRLNDEGSAPAFRGSPAFLLPDSTDRATCVSLVPAAMMLPWLQDPNAGKRDWLMSALGPCAFYGAFGAPGRPVRRWLAARQFDIARHPDWDETGASRFSGAAMLRSAAHSRWFWPQLYRYPLATIGCLGGRSERCREAVLDGVGAMLDDSIPRSVVLNRPWWHEQLLVPGERYLADVARTIGHDRFQRFWNSTASVETSLAAALKEPIGEWTLRWERSHVPRARLGAAPPWPSAVLGVALAGAVIALVALGAQRRQVG